MKYRIRFSNDDTYLKHHGIPGMHWGERRFQNPDGTLTEEGKARYLKGMDDSEKKAYNNMSDSDRRYIEKQMDNGRSFKESRQELAQRKNRIATIAIGVSAAAIAGTGVFLAKNGRTLLDTIHVANERRKFKKALRTGMRDLDDMLRRMKI